MAHQSSLTSTTYLPSPRDTLELRPSLVTAIRDFLFPRRR